MEKKNSSSRNFRTGAHIPFKQQLFFTSYSLIFSCAPAACAAVGGWATGGSGGLCAGGRDGKSERPVRVFIASFYLF